MVCQLNINGLSLSLCELKTIATIVTTVAAAPVAEAASLVPGEPFPPFSSGKSLAKSYRGQLPICLKRWAR